MLLSTLTTHNHREDIYMSPANDNAFSWQTTTIIETPFNGVRVHPDVATALNLKHSSKSSPNYTSENIQRPEN